jgi:hypothetical protein
MGTFKFEGKKMRRFLMILLAITMMGLTSCSASTMGETSQATVDATQVFHSALLTATWSVPTWTPVPPTHTPQATSSPTALVYSQYKIVGAGMVGDQMMFTLSVPGVAGEFWAMVNNEKYTCTVQPGVADTLYCTGLPIAAGSDIKISVFPRESQQAALVLAFHLAQNPTGTPIPVYKPVASSGTSKTSNPPAPTSKPAAAQPQATQVPCPEWCYYFVYPDGTVVGKNCGFATARAAGLRMHTGYVPEMPNGTAWKVSCTNGLHYYLTAWDLGW